MTFLLLFVQITLECGRLRYEADAARFVCTGGGGIARVEADRGVALARYSPENRSVRQCAAEILASSGFERRVRCPVYFPERVTSRHR